MVIVVVRVVAKKKMGIKQNLELKSKRCYSKNALTIRNQKKMIIRKCKMHKINLLKKNNKI